MVKRRARFGAAASSRNIVANVQNITSLNKYISYILLQHIFIYNWNFRQVCYAPTKTALGGKTILLYWPAKNIKKCMKSINVTSSSTLME